MFLLWALWLAWAFAAIQQTSTSTYEVYQKRMVFNTTGKSGGVAILDTNSGGKILASYPLQVNNILFTTGFTTTTWINGQLYWDNSETTLNLNVHSWVSLSIGKEMYTTIVNKSWTGIIDWQVVFISGAQGNRPTAYLAIANNFLKSYVLGIATENIANNAEGNITTYGEVHGYNTTSFIEWDKLYLSSTISWGYFNECLVIVTMALISFA